nr:isoprenyl transferase [Sediminivirga luteola]
MAGWLYRLYDRRILKTLDEGARGAAELPRHVGVITDGNRRWAKTLGATTRHGHQVGAEKLVEFLGWCDELGIDVVTLYLLSTENLSRGREELQALEEIISGVVDRIAAQGTRRVRLVGAKELIPESLRRSLEQSMAQTEGALAGTVNVAVGYGGRQEIVEATRSLLRQRAAEGATLEQVAEELTPEQIADHLYTRGQPDPDLIIRTSGEQRLSGFLMWQSAYSEFYFCEAYWPDFRRTDFLRALRTFEQRSRRFGK